MTFPQINISLLINENAMRIILDIYLGPYYQVQAKLSIASLKGLRMIGIQEQKSYKETLSRMLLRSTIPW